MKRALYMGRFQPFHKGHLEVVKRILSENDKIIVAIGSANFNYNVKSPFTAGERMWMIHEALVEAGIDMSKVYITSYPNIENNAAWYAHIKSLLPPFHRAYTGNPLTQILLKENGIEVVVLKMIERELYCASTIRERMLRDEPWEELVPPAVARIIKAIKGPERLKYLVRSESDPMSY
ncbi:nicotinamide-nucleotide adenylyltransferase [Thermosulfidibacter takaii ABI70S6]|uniref:Nicotinamide-nucleotide adenylyltransferase n=1 Tax=Thermosulfidibacter takaii (strain DSM 17441 / JCM 13301 / NBRC 103674 / ABI70S6) TaxID=1298851 RepID=A0A0S3QSK8_THET7|nr:nicotinamide-nucleotide adenylyltransferase [Thermosulfidibacter takaii]BAT71323.1 nicotinamide-nucleotide adenylyltransferase [Thermosulfidibacter takaii ABI70S6]